MNSEFLDQYFKFECLVLGNQFHQSIHKLCPYIENTAKHIGAAINNLQCNVAYGTFMLLVCGVILIVFVIDNALLYYTALN